MPSPEHARSLTRSPRHRFAVSASTLKHPTEYSQNPTEFAGCAVIMFQEEFAMRLSASCGAFIRALVFETDRLCDSSLRVLECTVERVCIMTREHVLSLSSALELSPHEVTRIGPFYKNVPVRDENAGQAGRRFVLPTLGQHAAAGQGAAAHQGRPQQLPPAPQGASPQSTLVTSNTKGFKVRFQSESSNTRARDSESVYFRCIFCAFPGRLARRAHRAARAAVLRRRKRSLEKSASAQDG